MDITLILAASPRDPLRKNDPFMPLSLPLLAASAPDHDYHFVDMLAGETPNLSRPTDLVGISARSTAEKTAFEIADAFRARGIPVVLGGPQPSSVPLQAIRHADAVVVGEGEPVWPRLISDLQGGALKAFYLASPKSFDVKNYPVYQTDAAFDLAQVPIAIDARKRFSKKYVFDTVFAARGCSVDCDFCSVSHLFGKKTRLRPIADVVREIESFKGFYYLLDDTVFGRPHTYDYYADLYDAIADIGRMRLWTGQANLDAAATPEGQAVIKKAARSGLVYAAIGMESINPEVQKKSGTIKKMGVTHAENVALEMKEHIRFIQDQGIAISGWFTIGYPEDSIDTFQRTLDFCLETNIIPVLCPLEALPGTRLFCELEKEGRLDAKKRINIVHKTLTDEEILGALHKATLKGFSLGEITKRTRFYARKFSRDSNGNKAPLRTRIEKTIFVHVLQTKMKKGVIGLTNEL